MRKPPIIAAHRGIGTGMGKTMTRNFGVSTVSTPPKAKIAPEAPIATEKGDARSIKSILPSIPPRKYTIKRIRVPSSLVK